MKTISQPNQSIFQILSRMKKPGNPGRLLHYCVEVPVEDGVLLFNLLTREMVLLTGEEYRYLTESQYLEDHWFLVSEGANDKEYADLIRWVLANKKIKSKNITDYTIFTTTDCNARCFYCFEIGRSRIPMSVETARKVVRYIKDHCGREADPGKAKEKKREPRLNCC